MFKKILRMVGILFRIGLILGLLAILLPLVLRASTALAFRSRTYPVETVPARPVAIIFGARVYSDERLSAMLQDRVATGVDLYHAGKVHVLLMTGHRDESENEPEAMRRYALEMGVPSEAIVLDYAGSRTYDSCYRAREVFQVESAILVTQNFHLDRALMLCSALGVEAVGVWADYQRPWGYSRISLNWSRLREIPATVAAALDIIRRPTPVLGEPLPIDAPRAE